MHRHPLRRTLPAYAVADLGAAKVEEGRVLCDAACTAKLEKMERTTLPSGLQYIDLVEGKGPTPPVGFQVSAMPYCHTGFATFVFACWSCMQHVYPVGARHSGCQGAPGHQVSFRAVTP